jgi:hypothetical protein
MVSICRGGEALVWDFEKVKQTKQFTWKPDKYRFKACRLVMCHAALVLHPYLVPLCCVCVWGGGGVVVRPWAHCKVESSSQTYALVEMWCNYFLHQHVV